MSYLTEYYKNKSIILQEQVTNLENVLNFIKENPDYYLQEDWREKLAKIFGKAADDAAKAASRPWDKFKPTEWPKLPKNIALQFIGKPLTWKNPTTGVTRQYVLKVIKSKTGSVDHYEVWRFNEQEGIWKQQFGGQSPWGNVGKTSGAPSGGPNMVPQPGGGWANASATLAGNIGDSGVGDSGSVKQFMNQNNTGNAGGDDETITV